MRLGYKIPNLRQGVGEYCVTRLGRPSWRHLAKPVLEAPCCLYPLLAHDEGPFYQMQRMDRYKEVIQQMLANGSAYHCYTSREELDVLRAEQEARKEKPRYDGRWRPNT